MTNKFPLPKKYLAAAVQKTQLNKRVTEVIFHIDDPNEINFLPGQFVSLNVENGLFRSYSVASSCGDSQNISLLIEVAHDGYGANFTKQLKIGDKVELIGPSGRFVVPEDLKNDLVFVATGTGIAPLLSMFDHLKNIRYQGNITLYFGVRDKEELFKIDYLDSLQNEMSSFKYYVCYSQTLPSDAKANEVSGRVTDKVEIKLTTEAQYFLCGHPMMITDMTKILTEQGVALDNIYHERFTVSQKKS